MKITLQRTEIDCELAACRAAWAQFFINNDLEPDSIMFKDNTPILAWCLHHEELAERLEEPIENRISYILSDKLKEEQACRFLNLRPMSSTAIKVHDAAWAEYDKVCDAALAEYDKVRYAARAEYDKVC